MFLSSIFYLFTFNSKILNKYNKVSTKVVVDIIICLTLKLNLHPKILLINYLPNTYFLELRAQILDSIARTATLSVVPTQYIIVYLTNFLIILQLIWST